MPGIIWVNLKTFVILKNLREKKEKIEKTIRKEKAGYKNIFDRRVTDKKAQYKKVGDSYRRWGTRIN